MYIDDRWLYDLSDDLPSVIECDLREQSPRCLYEGKDVTIVGCGYSTELALKAARELLSFGVSAEVVDIRVLNPFRPETIVQSVRKTGRLLVVDGGWRTAGFSAEVIASVVERLPGQSLKATPRRVTLPDAPAPTSRVLEKIYYPQTADVLSAVKKMMS
jgi:pyruvate dehydrogenase E1 component beta subunit